MVDQVIKLKRNTANTNAPDTGDIVVGELAIGAVAGKLYMRKSDDSILTFSDDSNVSTTLTIAADSGSNDTVTVGTNTLTFNGTSNQIGTTVSDNAITIALADNPVIGGTGSIRVPDGTTGQRPGSPAAGMFRYNTTTSKFEGYTDDWGDIGGGGANTFTRNAYTGDGSTTAFTLSQTVNSENDLIVFIEGVFQDQDAYSVSGTTLTFDTAPVNGRGIIVYSVKHTVAGSNLNIDTMTGDGSDTTLSLTISPNDENNTQVFIDGVYQNKSTYSISGSTLTFSTAPPNGSAVECMTFTQTDVNEATYVTANANNSTNETVYPVFVDGATGKQEIETDTGLTYNPSTGNLTIGGALTAATLDISGDIDIDGTLEADAITVNGTTLAETISDTVGAMVSSNTETGITVTYEDGDNTLDFALGAAQTTITSLLATDIKIGEDDQTKIDFETADTINFYAGNEKQLILTDGALTPGADNILDLGSSSLEFKDAFFDGTVTADAFAGPLTGDVTGNVSGTAATVTTAAQTNITSLGTLTALTGGTGDLIWDTNTLFVDSSANKIYIGDTASHTDDFLQIESPASGGGHGIQIRRNDSNTDQGIGRILFGNNTDTDLVQIHAKTDGATDNGALIFSTQPDSGSLTERMRITHDGEVGIGTASPAYDLHVEGSGVIAGLISRSGSGTNSFENTMIIDCKTGNDAADGFGPALYFSLTDSGVTRSEIANISVIRDGADNSGQMQFGVRNAGTWDYDAMVIDSTSKVGIGTASPATTLHVLQDSAKIQLESNGSDTGVQLILDGAKTSNGAVGDIVFENAHDTVAMIRAERVGGNDDAADMSFYTQVTGGSNAEKMRITSAGDVGIGVSPVTNSRLTVKTQGDGTYPIRVVNSADTDMLFGVYESSDGDGNNGMLYLNDGSGNTDVKISTNGDSYFNGGKVAIGADHADEPLTVRSSAENINTCLIEVGNDLHATNTKDAWIKFVAGAATNDYSWAIGAYPTDFRFSYLGARGTAVATAANVRMQISSGGRQTYNDSSTANGHANFVGEVGSNSKAISFEHTNGGGEVGTIVTGSSSTTYNTSSDYRLKENVDYDWDATTRLKQLKPARFNWIVDDTNTLLEGFLAHEVSTVVPNAVTGGKDAMADPILYEDGDELPSGKKVGDVKKESAPAYQGIDHSKLVPLLVKTIQELEARIKTLEDA